MIITLHGRRQLLDRTWCNLCYVTFTCYHRDHVGEHKAGGGAHTVSALTAITALRNHVQTLRITPPESQCNQNLERDFPRL